MMESRASVTESAPVNSPARRAKVIHAFFKLLRKKMTASGSGWLDLANLRSQTPPPLPLPTGMSEFSSPAVKNGSWCSQNFVIGAGMVIIQPSTNKIVLVYRPDKNMWFLPKGRKDIGESIEQTALREAYEESGYKVDFLPLLNPSCALAPLEDPDALHRPNTEPIYSSIKSWVVGGARREFEGEYFTFWYVGQIGPDAVRHSDTGMDNEKCFSSQLVTYDDAMKKVWGDQRRVLEYAWAAYLLTMQVEV